MIVLIAVGGMLILAGLALAIALAAGVQMPQRTRPGSADAAGTSRWLRREYVIAVAVGIAAMLATGWVAAGAGAAAVVVMAPAMLRPSAASTRHIARLEALASWTRRLADLLASGAAQTMQDALTRTAVTSPPADRRRDRRLGVPDGPTRP